MLGQLSHLGECTSGKRQYRGRVEALAEMRAIRDEIEPGRKKPVRAYECPVCGFWHLTKKGRRR